MMAVAWPAGSSRRRCSSRSNVGRASSMSASGVRPDRAATVASARSICFRTFRFVTVTRSDARALGAPGSLVVPSNAAQVLARAVSRTTASLRPDVPIRRPTAPRTSAGRSITTGASQTRPRASRWLMSRSPPTRRSGRLTISARMRADSVRRIADAARSDAGSPDGKAARASASQRAVGATEAARVASGYNPPSVSPSALSVASIACMSAPNESPGSKARGGRRPASARRRSSTSRMRRVWVSGAAPIHGPASRSTVRSISVRRSRSWIG